MDAAERTVAEDRHDVLGVGTEGDRSCDLLGVFEGPLADVGPPAGESSRLADEYLHTIERLGLT